MRPNKCPPDDLLETAISQLKTPIPDNLGHGLERDVYARLLEEGSENEEFFHWAPLIASITILLIGVSIGILKGARYERLVQDRYEEAYVASIHPIMGASAHTHGDER